MRRNLVIAAIAMTFAMSTRTVYASEGLDITGSEIVFDIDEGLSTNNPEPILEDDIEPIIVEPEEETTKVVEALEVEPEYVPEPIVLTEHMVIEEVSASQDIKIEEEVADSSNDEHDSNESSDNSNNNSDDGFSYEKPNQLLVMNSAPMVVENESKEEVSVKVPKKAEAKKLAKKTITEVSASKNVNLSLIEDRINRETISEAYTEEISEEGRSIEYVLLCFLALLVCELFIIFASAKREYQVVKTVINENGEQKMTVLKKFFSVKKACEFVRDFMWEKKDDNYDALSIVNKNREERLEDKNGNNVDVSLIYKVSKDKAIEEICYATDVEVDSIGRILGFIQQEVLA